MTQAAQELAYRTPADSPDVRKFRLEPVACARELRTITLRKAGRWALIALAADALFWVAYGTSSPFVYVFPLMLPAMTFLRVPRSPVPLLLAIADEADEMDDAERARLHESLRRSIGQAKAGQLVDGDQVIERLLARR